MQSGLCIERLRASLHSEIVDVSWSDLSTMLAECVAVHVKEPCLLKIKMILSIDSDRDVRVERGDARDAL